MDFKASCFRNSATCCGLSSPFIEYIKIEYNSSTKISQLFVKRKIFLPEIHMRRLSREGKAVRSGTKCAVASAEPPAVHVFTASLSPRHSIQTKIWGAKIFYFLVKKNTFFFIFYFLFNLKHFLFNFLFLFKKLRKKNDKKELKSYQNKILEIDILLIEEIDRRKKLLRYQPLFKRFC
jgi:hypothetical protein